VVLPQRQPGDNRLTVFIELDDTVLHTFIYDENFGFMSDPHPREPEHVLHFGDKRIPIRVYMRAYAHEFLQFFKDNKHIYEPIVYTAGVPGYTELLLDILDPKREIFEHKLYQNACYVFEKKDEDIYQLVKDVSRFKATRDMRRCVLLDPNPLNFMLTPENGLPVIPYTAEIDSGKGPKDDYLLGMIEQIKDLEKSEDTRAYLRENYNVRQILKNARLL